MRVEMTELGKIASELLERSTQFEPPAPRDGLAALEKLGSLAELARISLAPPPAVAAPAAPVAAVAAKRAPVARPSTDRAEYSPALQDPHLVDALMLFHSEAYAAVHRAPATPSFSSAPVPEVQAQPKLPPIQRSRVGVAPQIFRPKP